MDYLDRVFEIMESFGDLGQRVLDNGTRLIGSVPHVAPEAWFQIVFAPLALAELPHVEHLIRSPLPEVFSSFLQRCNGLSLFSDFLNIYGLRKSFARTGDDVWQPFSLKTPNVDERPKHSKPSFVFIGGYRWDGSRLYIDSSDLHVYRCKQRSAKPLNRWESFELMLESEVERLSMLFDREGRIIDPEKSTTP